MAAPTPDDEALLEGLLCGDATAYSRARAAFLEFLHNPREVSLELDDCGVLTLPPRFFVGAEAKRRLQVLSVRTNDLTDLPSLRGLAALTCLDCAKNKLTTLPAGLTECPRLVELMCAKNRLTSLEALVPAAACSALELLDCGYNLIATLPTNIARLSALKWFDCNDNLLTTIPAGLGDIETLEALGLSNNQIAELPAEAFTNGRFLNLEWLAVEDNELEDIPAEVGACESLDEVKHTGNGLRLMTSAGDLSPKEMAAWLRGRWESRVSRVKRAAA